MPTTLLGAPPPSGFSDLATALTEKVPAHSYKTVRLVDTRHGFVLSVP